VQALQVGTTPSHRTRRLVHVQQDLRAFIVVRTEEISPGVLSRDGQRMNTTAFVLVAQRSHDDEDCSKIRRPDRLMLAYSLLSPLMASFHEQMALVEPLSSFFGISSIILP
jgi:hypothetical protein